MGRARTKQKKSARTTSDSTTPSSSPSVLSLLSKAQDLIVQCDYPLARKFTERVLAREDATPAERDQAREMLAVVLLEVGDVDDAKDVRRMTGYWDPTERAALDPPYPRTPSSGGSVTPAAVCISVPRTAHGRRSACCPRILPIRDRSPSNPTQRKIHLDRKCIRGG